MDMIPSEPFQMPTELLKPSRRRQRLKPEAGAQEPSAPPPSSPTAAEVTPAIPAPVPVTPLPVNLPAVDEAPPLPPPARMFPGSTLCQHDVVQIIAVDNRGYGMFLVVGDVRNGQVHGYTITEGRNKQFVTVPEAGVFPIGVAKIRAKVVSSPKWQADNR